MVQLNKIQKYLTSTAIGQLVIGVFGGALLEGIKFAIEHRKEIDADTEFDVTIIDIAHSSAMIIGVLWFFLILNWVRRQWHKAKLAEQAGLSLYLKHDGTESDEEIIKNEIVNSLSGRRNIKIWGATGYHTFGSDGAFLRPVIESADGEIKVILLDYDDTNHAAKNRAKELRMDYKEYQREIVASVRYLKELYERGRNVSVYLYHHSPKWKLYITSATVIVQNYQQGMHVAETQAFGFNRSKNSKPNFYDYFCRLFDRAVMKLESPGKLVKCKIDLATWTPPKDL